MNPHSEPMEILDRPGLPFEDRLRSLADLARSNRLLLGYRVVLRTLLPQLSGAGRVQTLLDLGAGAGDVADRLARASSGRGVDLRIVAVDSQLAHLVIGRRQFPAQWRVVADAKALPFRAGAVDWSFCNQFLHHFGAREAGRVLGEMRRICRAGAVVVDLRGGWLIRVGAALLLPLIGVGEVGRHDGRISARQAYRLTRLRELLAGTPWVELRGRFPGRLSLILPPLASHELNRRQSAR